MNKSLQAHIGLFIANLIYGANHTIAKEVMPKFVQPFAFIILRVTGAFILFYIAHVLWVKEKIDKADIPRFIFCALFGVAINQLLFFKGLSLTTPIHSAIIVTTNPIAVLIFASILIKEKVTFQKVTGIALGFIGALILIIFGKKITNGTDTVLGDVYIFINAMSYSVFIVIVKPLMEKYHFMTVVKWIFLIGMIMVIPFGWKEIQLIEWSALPASAWMGIIYVIVGSTFLGYLLNTSALKVLNASVVSIYIYIQPVLAALIAILSGKDTLTVSSIVASSMIFVGVYLVSKPTKVDVKM